MLPVSIVSRMLGQQQSHDRDSHVHSFCGFATRNLHCHIPSLCLYIRLSDFFHRSSILDMDSEPYFGRFEIITLNIYAQLPSIYRPIFDHQQIGYKSLLQLSFFPPWDRLSMSLPCWNCLKMVSISKR
jgi:hypothetical protein